MTDVAIAVERTKDLLQDRARFPWKTAGWLARQLRHEGIRVSAHDLEGALLREAENEGRQVRYSIYPGRHALDLIWGHIDHVGETGHLPPPTLEPDPALAAQLGEITPCAIAEGAPWCFLSHNFHDVRTALGIRTELIGRGYGVWLAETEILQGEMITMSVQEGLKRSDLFVVLMSANALASRWVLKESGVAIRRLANPPIVIVDPADQAVAALFADWVRGTWSVDRAARIDQIVVQKGHEPASTLLDDLLGAFDDVAVERRIVLPYPPQPTVPPLASWDAVLPRRDEAGSG